jgi:O-antigen/teichoic acid export membrane protein
MLFMISSTSTDPRSDPRPAAQRSHASVVTSKALRGVAALGGRQVAVHGFNILGSIFLARLLSPADFGIYAIVVFLIQFLGTFGGTGLACNLIRVHDAPSEHDYHAVFTVQQAIIGVLVLGLWAGAGLLVRFYHLPHHYVWLFRMAAASLFITSFMVVPQIRLERELAFSRLAVIEVWQAVVFNFCSVGLAWFGWGGMAFAVALVARSFTGALAAYWVEPWKIFWTWDWPRARKHLGFGLFYQSTQIISLVKDSLTPILIGYLVGVAGVGYIGWSGMLAAYPVLVLMVLQRVYLPTFSRLQHDRPGLARLMEQTILANNALAAPVAALTLILIHPLTVLVFGAKWLAAVPVFYLFWLANLLTPISTPVQGLLNALGKSKVTFAFAALWAVLTWVLGVPLVLWLGPAGAGWVAVSLQITTPVLFAFARRELNFAIWRPSVPPWILAFVCALPAAALQHWRPAEHLVSLAAYALLSTSIYLIALAVSYPREIKGIFRLFRQPLLAGA